MSKKSVAEIIAEIKAKIPEIDAQLNAIDVGELPDIVVTSWRGIRERLPQLFSMLEDEATEAQFVQLALFDLRHSTGLFYNCVHILSHFDEISSKLSSDVHIQLQAVFIDIQGFMDNYGALYTHFFAKG